MQKQSEEEWKSTFVESKKKVQDDVSPEELSLVNAILDLIEKVEKKEITIPESNRELRHITELFQQLKRQLLSYRAEKWNRDLKHLQRWVCSSLQKSQKGFTMSNIISSNSPFLQQDRPILAKPGVVAGSEHPVRPSSSLSTSSSTPALPIPPKSATSQFVVSSLHNTVHSIQTKENSLSITDISSSLLTLSVKDSVILIREITGSVYVKDVSNSIISVNCQQIRIHCTTNSLFCLQIPNHPVIEDSNSVSFSENVFIWGQELAASVQSNRFADVLDFNWLRKEKSPNWKRASLSEFLLDHNTLLALLKRAMGFSFVRIDSGQVGMLEGYFCLFETQTSEKILRTKIK
ncbi:uncharacterized protein [Blastocystis hominis]|uniref:C-CAP/cofactor C-like domain-containing protein n=1 Tax=Blastocystis hominis TaxID=12968 RepID=D8M7D8_BLAHO|nr:uncharacterized protein [Blastocystis hominis]CBK23977.2 unnamed protein product [Blastocystis hominis]|eukprot:XP_012898025.1 uncharacterized protein [Blastocystis hominis]